jgi:hypothetical protein
MGESGRIDKASVSIDSKHLTLFDDIYFPDDQKVSYQIEEKNNIYKIKLGVGGDSGEPLNYFNEAILKRLNSHYIYTAYRSSGYLECESAGRLYYVATLNLAINQISFSGGGRTYSKSMGDAYNGEEVGMPLIDSLIQRFLPTKAVMCR